MIILKSIDVEDVIRQALSGYMIAYCRPLPASYRIPNILVQQVGGTVANTIDTFEVVLDARANTEAEASETIRTAIGLLRAVAAAQTTALRYVSVNSSGSWGTDPVRPELAMYSARLRVTVHQERTEVNRL